MVIDGKTMVRSRNPYYLTMPNEPEYVYTEKGKELKTLQGMIEKSIARRMGLSKDDRGQRGFRKPRSRRWRARRWTASSGSRA